jgi:L-lactate dehydrogenase complex protein LldF
LIDNGRTKLLADREKRQSLYCIRCGACLNICPVYRKIGGHSFPWVYSGPIGAIITPQFMGPMHEPGLPFASSLCGACAEVCPVKIDIPKVLLDLRVDVKKAEARDGQGKLERLAFRIWAWVMRHPRIYEMAGMAAGSLAPEATNGYIRSAPPLLNHGPIRGWLSQRDLPAPAPKSFRQMWRARSKQ